MGQFDQQDSQSGINDHRKPMWGWLIKDCSCLRKLAFPARISCNERRWTGGGINERFTVRKNNRRLFSNPKTDHCLVGFMPEAYSVWMNAGSISGSHDDAPKLQVTIKSFVSFRENMTQNKTSRQITFSELVYDYGLEWDSAHILQCFIKIVIPLPICKYYYLIWV